jgi:tryptophan-rich sensory protein
VLLFLLQLALNFCWTLVFFHFHAIGLALVEIVMLWAAIFGTILVFARISRLSAWLLAPYLGWVSFATLLNAGFWRLN